MPDSDADADTLAANWVLDFVELMQVTETHLSNSVDDCINVLHVQF